MIFEIPAAPEQKPPEWFMRAREIAAQVANPVGVPFTSKKKDTCASLYLYGEIGKNPYTGEGINAQDVVAALQEAKGSDSLDIHLNSPGGLIFEGLAMFNAIKSFPGKKTCYVDGIAASIASVIALAADKVVMNEGAMFMVHEPAGGLMVMGGADRIEEAAAKTVRALRKVRENILDLYALETGRSLSEISGWMAAETFMTAAEAKDRGFADEVVAPPATEPTAAMAPPVSPPAPRVLSPLEMVAHARAQAASARAQAATLHSKFTGASPGVPGQPGAAPTTTPAPRQKETT